MLIKWNKKLIQVNFSNKRTKITAYPIKDKLTNREKKELKEYLFFLGLNVKSKKNIKILSGR